MEEEEGELCWRESLGVKILLEKDERFLWEKIMNCRKLSVRVFEAFLFWAFMQRKTLKPWNFRDKIMKIRHKLQIIIRNCWKL